MKKKGILTTISKVVLLVLSALLAFGTTYIFPACGLTDEGSYMTCHWAQVSVAAIGIAMLCISVLALLNRNADVSKGLCFALIPTAVITMVIPNILIPLCMKTDMRCHSIMRPSVIVVSALIIAFALIAVFSSKKAGK